MCHIGEEIEPGFINLLFMPFVYLGYKNLAA